MSQSEYRKRLASKYPPTWLHPGFTPLVGLRDDDTQRTRAATPTQPVPVMQPALPAVADQGDEGDGVDLLGMMRALGKPEPAPDEYVATPCPDDDEET